MSVSEVFAEYQKNGILVRTNDGNNPLSQAQVLGQITNLVIEVPVPNPTELSTNLEGLVTSRVPPYSASLISSKTPPVVWYNFTYSEIAGGGTTGDKTIVSILFKNKNINVYGGCCWDGDSNQRCSGNIQPTTLFNRSNPFNIASQLPQDVSGNVTTGIGYNNNPTLNPMFYPRTETARASNYQEVGDYLNMMGEYKGGWVENLKSQTSGAYNAAFGTYVDNYTTGVEPEILITSNTDTATFANKKFNPQDILCIAIVTDALEFSTTITDAEYKTIADQFITSISADPGWLTSANVDVPVMLIKHVAMPNVPVDGTTTPDALVGGEWVEYLDPTGAYNYGNALTIADFKSIYTPAVLAPICFLAGTPVLTNQGRIDIDNIIPGMHTIRNEHVVAITQTICSDDEVICFEKDSLAKNIPSQQTIVSKQHKFYYKGYMIEARYFVLHFEKVTKIKYNGAIMYNVLLENYRKMNVNNLIAETLYPGNTIAIIYNNKTETELNNQFNVNQVQIPNNDVYTKTNHLNNIFSTLIT